MKSSRIALAIALIGTACADDPSARDVAELGDGRDSVAGPGLVAGADDIGADTADTHCQVVLREVARVPNGTGGYATSADGRFVWDGEVEVAASAEALGSVAVLFQTNETRDRWFAVAATRVAGEGPVVRYHFRIDRFTPTVGTSTTSLSRTVIRLIPYIALNSGGRAFDHNRVSDLAAAYELTAQNGWTIARDATCSSVENDGVPRWSFSYPDFAETFVGGPVVAGGRVRIAYDGRRLREVQGCMGAHGPASATTLYVHYLFNTDSAEAHREGQAGQAEVERYTVASGFACAGGASPCVSQEVFEALIVVPADAEDLAVWFTCVPGFDAAPNVKYDSNEGANYRVEVVAGTGHPVDWVGAWGLYRARPGDVLPLENPFVYNGFSNMGFAFQAEVWVDGVRPEDLLVFVESDASTCDPGGAVTREHLSLSAKGAGPFGNNAVFRWGVESLLGRCPAGSYRYRFVVSADGGLSETTLGAASEASPSAPDPTFRTIENRRP